MKKRVYVAYTGGTIGMRKNKQGQYEPQEHFLEAQMREMSEFNHDSMPNYEIHQYKPLLDSSNMTPMNWVKIARDIQANYDKFDGFIILHGTDTMAYTASALSFMLRGPKPIIITGSQVPLCEIRNDARDNLITSLIIASRFAIPEVCLYFGGKLLRGCRAVKVSAEGFQAFESPNFPSLGTAGVRIEINRNLIQPLPFHTELLIQEFKEPVVAAMRLFPGISAQVMNHILQPPLKGLVLEAYGAGNGPIATEGFVEVLKKYTSQGVVIVAVTQCWHGKVDLGAYATSLAHAGVTSGLDMTAEATLTKLFYLFSLGYSPEVVRQEMVKNLRGELTSVPSSRADSGL
jgi:L-asparaginase